MSRTTADLVKGILVNHYDLTNNPSLTPFIDTASSLVTRVDDLDTDGVLSSDNLELIERWLAAHFYAHADQLLQSKNTGKASGSFQGQTAMVFNSTQYGQTAMALDFTGKLAQMNKEVLDGTKHVAGVLWMGTELE